uniref:Uncharacterized protein n=1 Tax=Schistosoma japonicum TaxID=6182 RepID=C1LFZ5_SCHJA|nr:hypothetical protein [Schistosoma japonicum]
MSITLSSFKQWLISELDSVFVEDLGQMLISVVMQEVENVWEEVICLFRNSRLLSQKEKLWPNMIKDLGKTIKEIFLEVQKTEIEYSSFMSLQNKIQQAIRDRVYIYKNLLNPNNKQCSSCEPVRKDDSNTHIHSSCLTNELSLEEFKGKMPHFNANNHTETSKIFCSDYKREYSQVNVTDALPDETLLNQIQAKPIISVTHQPSYIMKTFEDKVILTPDVRPTDRRCVSEILLQTMGPLWNDYTERFDGETNIQLDRNLPVVDENEEIFTNLINTINKDFNEMKFTSNTEDFKFAEIPAPDELDLKPIYETARRLFDNNFKSIHTDFSKSFLMDKSKWVLPFFKLYTDEDESKFRKSKILPSSKLDELFSQEVEKHKKGKKKIKKISCDNFEEKRAKILTELKNEEKKMDKLKTKLIKNQYKCDDAVLWKTGNDVITDNEINNYESLKSCEENINLLKSSLTNLVDTSPFCSIYRTGKETSEHQLNTLQQRLSIVWNKLKLSESERQNCLLKLCWKDLNETTYKENINKALELLEHVADYVERRETLLYKLAKIETEHLNQSKDCSLDNGHSELLCSNERDKVLKKLNKLDKVIEFTAKQLKTKFNYNLTFNGQVYLTKMIHDRSDLIYLIKEICKDKEGQDNAK